MKAGARAKTARGQRQSRQEAVLERTGADIAAAGSIGCIVQIGRTVEHPVVHTVELLDWATGGPCPPALARGDEP